MEDRTDTRQRLGKKGEDIACRLLESRGHRIIERNFRCGHLEIDIISADRDGIHFVEVKTRRENMQAPPQDAVGTMKQRNIARAAKKFLNTATNIPPNCDECFFDVVAVTVEDRKTKVEYFPQAYIPIYL